MGGLPIPAQRETLKLIFDDIHLDKPVDRLTRWSNAEQRLAHTNRRPGATHACPAFHDGH